MREEYWLTTLEQYSPIDRRTLKFTVYIDIHPTSFISQEVNKGCILLNTLKITKKQYDEGMGK